MNATGASRALPADLGNPLCRLREADRELFDRKLRSWMPPAAFDAHAHLYDLRHLYPQADESVFAGPVRVGYDVYANVQQAWMGDRRPAGGLFFAFPVRHLDAVTANQLVLEEVRPQHQSRGLLLIRPNDDPVAVEQQITRDKWLGFKVYHVFAAAQDTFEAGIGEFLPEWAWELADHHGLAIMLHLVRARALADPGNQHYIGEYCRRYRNARLVLAHAARGFCSAHTVEGIASLRGLDNVWFDTSAICEPQPFEAILREFGTTRLMYGSDFCISEMHARPVSLGDGFYWLYEDQVDWTAWKLGLLTLCGIESLLALQQACRTCGLRDGDVERVFRENASQLLGLDRSDAQNALAERSTGVEGHGGQALYRHAKEIFPGGTQLLSKRPEQFAPGRWPPYQLEARGCEVIDVDGRHYYDFSSSGIGACLLGFNHPRVREAVIRRVTLGSMSTLNAPEEVLLADRLIQWHPWADQVRLARGGGEAMSVAVRIARAATQRELIAFCGYHGWHDWYLSANLGEHDALDGHLLPGLWPLGVPRSLRGTALPFAYNGLDELRTAVQKHGGQLAAVVMEPTRNVEPQPGFLAGVRELCDSCGAKLIFDEVTSGFRFHRGGVHLKYGVEPDVAVFAKALGNGHPIAAVIGRADTMQAAQDSFISSTYWTEAVGPTAALATLAVMEDCDVPAHVATIGERYRAGMLRLAQQYGINIRLSGYPALTTFSFDHPQNAALITLFTTRMLDRGYLAGAGFYPTLAHQDYHVDHFISEAEPVFGEISESIRRDDVLARIHGQVKHSSFTRLT